MVLEYQKYTCNKETTHFIYRLTKMYLFYQSVTVKLIASNLKCKITQNLNINE